MHLETGESVAINGSDRFPMASTFKVPVAVQLLWLVDQGRLRLDSLITVAPSDIHPGSGEISNLLDDPGVVLSVRNLLELMLLISDNSATDILLRTAGGGPAVNARLAALGVRGISVDRPTVRLIADAVGVKELPPESQWTKEVLFGAIRAVPDSMRQAAGRAFYDDLRDTATPEGMTALLAAIWRGQTLSAAQTALLLNIMERCQTGPARLKGMLPAGTRVMHKTGTLGNGVANDVGILALPDGAGHVAIAAFVKRSTSEVAVQERALAHAARAVYDYFLFRTR
jgi:beta-lactamase class A